MLIYKIMFYFSFYFLAGGLFVENLLLPSRVNQFKACMRTNLLIECINFMYFLNNYLAFSPVPLIYVKIALGLDVIDFVGSLIRIGLYNMNHKKVIDN